VKSGVMARSVSSDSTSTRRAWDLDTGLAITTFHCDASALCCACADEGRIVAGDNGGRIYFLALEE
jgi:hypothetical protein